MTHNDTVKNLEWFYKSEDNEKEIRPLENSVPAWKNEYIITVFELLLIPPKTHPNYLFTAVLITVILKKALSKNLLSVWEYKFELV